MANYKDIKYDFSGENLTALNATQLTSGTTPDARYTTLPAVSGANLTSLTATNLSSGTVPTARLGSGTASSSTVLYGDQTYKAEPGGGKVLQVVQNTTTTTTTITDSTTLTTITDLSVDITPSATTSKILVHMNCGGMYYGSVTNIQLDMLRDTTTVVSRTRHGYSNTGATWYPVPLFIHYLDSPSSTSALTYTFKWAFGAGTDVGGQANPSGGTNSGIVIAMEIGA